MKIKLGEIYRTNWDGTIARIIGFDDYEVFYDGYGGHDDSWTFASNLKKKGSFYRTAMDVFLDQSKRIDFKELTKTEFDIFRPDLTIRTCRIKDLSWADELLASERKLAEYMSKNYSTHDFPIIQTEKIWLYPCGPKGGFKKGEIIKAKDNGGFSTIELLVNASRIQREVNNNQTNGIGIYRIGIQRQIPSYYIGEYFDLAGIMKRKSRA